MAVNPTRTMGQHTPLSDMTLDQLLLIHGDQPVVKPIPERPPGPPQGPPKLVPRTAMPNPNNRRVTGFEIDGTPIYADPAPASPAAPTPTHAVATSAVPGPAPQAHQAQPRRAHVLVRPNPGPPPKPMSEPCAQVFELVFELDGLDPAGPVTVAYPLECEVLGEHPNQPHHATARGRLAIPDPDSRPQDVFIGWADALD